MIVNMIIAFFVVFALVVVVFLVIVHYAAKLINQEIPDRLRNTIPPRLPR